MRVYRSSRCETRRRTGQARRHARSTSQACTHDLEEDSGVSVGDQQVMHASAVLGAAGSTARVSQCGREADKLSVKGSGLPTSAGHTGASRAGHGPDHNADRLGEVSPRILQHGPEADKRSVKESADDYRANWCEPCQIRIGSQCGPYRRCRPSPRLAGTHIAPRSSAACKAPELTLPRSSPVPRPCALADIRRRPLPDKPAPGPGCDVCPEACQSSPQPVHTPGSLVFRPARIVLIDNA